MAFNHDDSYNDNFSSLHLVSPFPHRQSTSVQRLKLKQVNVSLTHRRNPLCLDNEHFKVKKEVV